MSDVPVPPPAPLSALGRPDRPRVWWGLGDFFIVFFTGFLLGQVTGGMYVLFSGATENFSSDLALIAWSLIGQCGGWVLAAAGIARWKGRGSVRADFGYWWPRLRDLPWLLVGVALQITTIVAFVPITLMRGDADAVQELVSAISGGSGVWKYVVVAAVVTVGPIAEEVVFRGVLLRALLRKLHPGWAVAISSVVFAGIHVVGTDPMKLLLGMVPWTAIGLVCGIRAVRSGGLAQPILVHIGFNLLTGVLLLLDIQTG